MYLVIIAVIVVVVVNLLTIVIVVVAGNFTSNIFMFNMFSLFLTFRHIVPTETLIFTESQDDLQHKLRITLNLKSCGLNCEIVSEKYLV